MGPLASESAKFPAGNHRFSVRPRPLKCATFRAFWGHFRGQGARRLGALPGALPRIDAAPTPERAGRPARTTRRDESQTANRTKQQRRPLARDSGRTNPRRPRAGRTHQAVGAGPGLCWRWPSWRTSARPQALPFEPLAPAELEDVRQAAGAAPRAAGAGRAAGRPPGRRRWPSCRRLTTQPPWRACGTAGRRASNYPRASGGQEDPHRTPPHPSKPAHAKMRLSGRSRTPGPPRFEAPP